MQYYALCYGTSIEEDIYTQVTGDIITQSELPENTQVASSSSQEDLYASFGVESVDINEYQDFFDIDTSASSTPSTPTEQSS